MRWLTRALLSVVLLMILAVAAGCARDSSCDKMDDRDRAESGITVLLTDVSGSVRGPGGGPDYATALAIPIDNAVDRGDLVFIGSFDGSSATVEWTAEHKLTYSDANRIKNQEIQRKAFKKCLKESVRTAAAAPARTDGTDVLAAIDVASQAGKESEAKGGRTIVVATDGMSTTGCFDLTGGGAGRTPWIGTLVEQCPSRPGWPHGLTGASLTMVGIGHPGAGRPDLASADVTFLGALWQRACETAGAVVCGISTLPVAKSGAGDAEGPVDPEVRFVPGVGAPEPPVAVTSAETDSLFDTDSAEVLPQGREWLVQWARPYLAAAAVEVIGHADIRDTTEHNKKLSEDRAAAIAQVLTEAGMTGVRSTGEGEQNASCRDVSDEKCLQGDRRVDIKVTISEG